MALSYNLKYKKLNFFHKVLLEKEGEIILNRQYFRLKGKGAGDQGETIYFADIKEMSVDDDYLEFTTFRKERYALSNFSNLFDSFIKDFFKVRNDFLAEALLMKVGMLYQEYDGQVEIVNRFGKFINRGMCRIQFYESSIVVIPEKHDCFVIYLNFLKNHELDEDEYVLKLYLDTGSIIQFSKLGTMLEDAQETLESLMGKMYEKIVNHLKEILPEFDPVTLLKLAYQFKDGKCVSFQVIKKLHEDLPKKIEALLFEKLSPAMKEKAAMLKSLAGDPQFYAGLSFQTRPDTRDLQMKLWFLAALPEKNILALSSGNLNEENVYFFRIVMEEGIVEEKLQDKILELNQSLFLSRFDFGILYKDKHDLKKTKFKTALRKLVFLRILRKSFIGKSSAVDLKDFKKDLDKYFIIAKLQQKTLALR
jgi:hypothetical protein